MAPLPVIHTIHFAIHNGSVVGIVTLILTFSIVRNRLKMAIEWAETCRDCNKNVINTLYSCWEWRFYFNRFDIIKRIILQHPVALCRSCFWYTLPDFVQLSSLTVLFIYIYTLVHTHTHTNTKCFGLIFHGQCRERERERTLFWPNIIFLCAFKAVMIRTFKEIILSVILCGKKQKCWVKYLDNVRNYSVTVDFTDRVEFSGDQNLWSCIRIGWVRRGIRIITEQKWVPEIVLGVKRGRHVRMTTSPHLWADCLENVGSSTSQNPIGLRGLLRSIVLLFSLWRENIVKRIKVEVARLMKLSCGLIPIMSKTNKLHGLSPRANYTDLATAACRRSDCQLLRIKGAKWSAWRIHTAVFSVF
jgi:hypothetical protein